MKTNWYSALTVLMPLIAAFFVVAVVAARSAHATEHFSVRRYSQRIIVWLTDQFFDHVVKLHVHTSLEWFSSLGLLALLSGKVATAILFEGTITGRTTWFIGAMLVSGFYQMYAVVHRHNIQARIEACVLATATWIFVFVSLVVAYMGETTVVAHVVFEYVLPFCSVFVVISILQTLILLRESMYPSLSREEQFAIAVFEEIRQVFELDESLKTEIISIVTHVARKLHIRQ